MKKIWILLLVTGICQINTFAQTSIEFIPSGGYTFADRVNFYNAYGKIDGAVNWGGSLMFNINRSFGIELMYNRIDTKSGLYQYGSPAEAISQGDLGINYIMLGGVQSFTIPGSDVHPFFGAMLGASVFSPKTSGYETDTKFTWGAQLGTNIYITPKFGLRLKAQLLAPSEATTGSFYFGSFGSGGGFSTYPDIYQFSLNAGLIIGLGKILPQQQIRRNNGRPRPRYRRYPPYPYRY